MNSKFRNKLYFPLLLVFILLNTFFISGKQLLVKYGINQEVIMVGNMILFVTSIASLYFHIKGFLHKNIQVFFRSVYGSLMIKMLVCAGAVVIYAMLAKDQVNKPAVFICMALYIVYSFIEVKMIFRLLKQKKQENE
ncbi:MAG: hypothetical protein QM725_08420 [Lacibacter sp.]